MNLFKTPNILGCKEVNHILYKDDKILIERIVSNGYCNDKGFFYDQNNDEWISVIQGEATISYRDGEYVYLTCGDTLFLPKHKKHRVESTSSSPPCIWLCVHIFDEKEEANGKNIEF